MTLSSFVFIYTLGGLTFLPLLLGLVLLHAHLTFPTRPTNLPPASDDLRQPGDDDILQSGAGGLDEKFRSRGRDADVAAGYFAVCREYVPGGVNGKPPERTTPAGAVVAAESPSVYQSMYRSIFDRAKAPTIDPGKGVRRARNVFFVVLRHGHLMLYDDAEQLEVRHVISLAHHGVAIYAGGHPIPEGELWIRRNAICLTRKQLGRDGVADASLSKPFFLFSENCSDKEDFYFALLQNKEKRPGSPEDPPTPMNYDIKHIISLVQRLHSSEEHLQTRWINGLIGRLFLALYKTQDIENLIRAKIAKKIARVKKPAFLTDIALQKVSMGDGAPYITNPRLKDLTVDGDCAAEMDLKYSGNFRIEVAATARIDLGSRFKAREVDLVLAVVLKRLDGHVILRFKPPPSNRIWFAFETMPKIEMSIEPIVSSRQITYNIILRAIESRIREVVAETLVVPHWDDVPFTDTMDQRFRGGVWADDQSPREDVVAREDDVAEEDVDRHDDAAELDPESISIAPVSRSSTGQTFDSTSKSASSPSIAPASRSSTNQTFDSTPKTASSASSQHAVDSPKSPQASKTEHVLSALSSRLRSEKPRPHAVRVASFSTSATPVVSMDKTTVDAVKAQPAGQGQDAASSMIAIAARSQPTSPTDSPVGSPSRVATLPEQGGSLSSTSSTESRDVKRSDSNRHRRTPSKTLQSSTPPEAIKSEDVTRSNSNRHGRTPSKTSLSSTPPGAIKSEIRSLPGFGNDHNQSSPHRAHFKDTFANADKKNSIPALTAATAAAKKWGWGVLARNSEHATDSTAGPAAREGTPEHPIGRGRPLPPPGTPLPHPEKNRARGTPVTILKRRPMPGGDRAHMKDDESPPRPSTATSQENAFAPDQSHASDVQKDATSPDASPRIPAHDGGDDFLDSMEMDDDRPDIDALGFPQPPRAQSTSPAPPPPLPPKRGTRQRSSIGREPDLYPSRSGQDHDVRKRIPAIDLEKKQA